MGRHSRRTTKAPAIVQAPKGDAFRAKAAWSESAAIPMSSRRYGAVAALAAATALSAVAVTTESSAPAAYAVAGAFGAPLQIVTDVPDLSRTYTVAVDGQEQELTTTADTWGRALTEADISVGRDDRVNVDLAAEVEDGATVTIERVTYEIAVDEQVDEFETVRKDDPNLEKGTERVTTEGRNGVTRVTHRVTLVDGEEESREQTIVVHKAERVDEVISVGTKEPEAAPVAEPAPASEAPAPAQAPAQAPAPAPAPAQPVVVNAGGAKGIAQQMVANKGWSSSEFQCLETLWQRESNWNHLAQNPSSGAYGIPQALPGGKMASHGADWRTNPATQIAWGLDYIQGRYGTPCGALNHSYARGWY
ncbi:G5 domain-containing protein [Flaviflexus huanghaiensis]|uniref:aggregation-promoting factor C-terminal-like domain-containing protein n=1 Tax=Flaviflexus huanghaiensis TaxID=1111473 RepID=UPI0015F83F70|nr:G5 domain-containing protein [Flaviflexus huanghaiensis]